MKNLLVICLLLIGIQTTISAQHLGDPEEIKVILNETIKQIKANPDARIDKYNIKITTPNEKYEIRQAKGLQLNIITKDYTCFFYKRENSIVMDAIPTGGKLITIYVIYTDVKKEWDIIENYIK
jgi:hypothetical protein